MYADNKEFMFIRWFHDCKKFVLGQLKTTSKFVKPIPVEDMTWLAEKKEGSHYHQLLKFLTMDNYLAI